MVGRRWWVGTAVAALIFLAVMSLTGGPRESQQLVKPHLAGLMRENPAEVQQVDLEREGRHLALVRAASGWKRAADRRPLSAPAAEHLDASLRFMHVAEPVRVMAGKEWQGSGEAEFGLVPPRLAVRLATGNHLILDARFGAPSPQETLQYARVSGRDELYL